MDERGLDGQVIAAWRAASADLGIRVTAPVELRDAGGPFACEAFVSDFGSPAGAVVVSEKAERRLRPRLRALGLWTSVEPRRQPVAYSRKRFIHALEDWGWFGEPGAEPDWYVDRH